MKVGSAPAVVTLILTILAVLSCGGAATPVTESNAVTDASMSATVEAQVATTIVALPVTPEVCFLCAIGKRRFSCDGNTGVAGGREDRFRRTSIFRLVCC